MCTGLVRKEVKFLCRATVCLSAWSFLSVWGRCVVVRFCSAAQSSIPKLPPALFSLHHYHIVELTTHTAKVLYAHSVFMLPSSPHGNIYIQSMVQLFQLYHFCYRTISKEVEETIVFRCSSPCKKDVECCSQFVVKTWTSLTTHQVILFVYFVFINVLGVVPLFVLFFRRAAITRQSNFQNLFWNEKRLLLHCSIYI